MLKCGATYHIQFAAPKKEGICDKCGSELVLRDDDKPETVQKRLEIYHDQTHPLIEYYEKKGVSSYGRRYTDHGRRIQEHYGYFGSLKHGSDDKISQGD